MHAARIAKSPRLQRVHDLLKPGGWCSTRDIMRLANVCAVNSCVAELRANGCDIKCRQQTVRGERLFFYRLVKAESGEDIR